MARKVLLTGAGGRVGGAILAGIGDRYDWRLMYHSAPAEEPAHPFVVGDVVEEDDCEAAVEGVDAVIHLAGDPRPEAPWESVLENNVNGTKNVYSAAVDAGVEKFVYASSNHAVGHYETGRTPDIYRPVTGAETGNGDDDGGPAEAVLLDGTELPRPGNFYGFSKAAGELLGRYFHDEYGLSVVCVRIGNLTKDHPPPDYERGQAMWLSYRDCAHLHDRCLRATYEYEIVYGISDNDRKFYSLDRAREVLGYDPKDNSAAYE